MPFLHLVRNVRGRSRCPSSVRLGLSQSTFCDKCLPIKTLSVWFVGFRVFPYLNPSTELLHGSQKRDMTMLGHRETVNAVGWSRGVTTRVTPGL